MRKSAAAFACVAICALAPAPASAEHRAGHRYCESAGAGPQTDDGPWYRQLHTYNLSCRKGFALMKRIARRHGTPTPGSYSHRVDGYRCKGRFAYHPEGTTYGSVSCRKGIRKVVWYGFSSDPGSGAGGGGGAPD